MSLSAVVISLARATARAEQVKHICRTCPVDCQVWEATDGARLSTAELAAIYQPRLHAPAYPFELRVGEIGCYLSHRRLWEKMVAEQTPQLLILEDDIEFLPDFEQALATARQHIPTDGYVQFQVRSLAVKPRKVLGSGRYALVEPSVVPLRTSAQLVTLGAAERLLRFSQQIDRPVDAAIQMTWLHGANVLVSQTRSVVEVSTALGGSTIGNRSHRGWLASAQRQWKRSFYRNRIAAHSRRHVA